jgi:hypothetical protein
MIWVAGLLILCIPLAGVYALVHLTQRALGRVPSRVVSLGMTLVAAGFLVTLATTLVPVEITPQNARTAEFGYPFHFVTADTALTPPEGETARVGYDPNEYPADVHVPQFLASWAVVTAALLLPLLLFAAARRRARGRPLRPSARRSA